MTARYYYDNLRDFMDIISLVEDDNGKTLLHIYQSEQGELILVDDLSSTVIADDEHVHDIVTKWQNSFI